MSKKISGVVALVGMCALSLFLLNCGSSSSRPSGVLYVLTQGSNGVGNNVSSFAIDLSSGNLSLINSNAATCKPVNACGLPLNIVLDPNGAAAFVLNQGTPSASVAPTIYSYAVNSDGSLGAPALAATLTTGDTPIAMVRDAAGQFLFVITQGVFPSPTTCPAIGTAAADANQAAVFAGCPTILVFAMGANSLTFVSQSATYQSPFFLSKIPSAPSTVSLTPPGGTAEEFLFVTNNKDICSVSCIPPSPHNDNTVSEYIVSSSGVLTEQPNSPYAIAAIFPISVLAVNTNPADQITGGLFVYVGNEDPNGGHLYPFQVCTVVGNAGCTLQDVQNNLMIPLGETCTQPPCNNVPPATAGQNPVQMLVDPTNNFIYVVSEGSSQVFGFKINTTAGTLSGLNPPNLPSQGSQPVAMALHPSVNNSGQFLFVSNATSSNIASFTLSTTTGSMTNPITVVAPAAPSGMAVH